MSMATEIIEGSDSGAVDMDSESMNVILEALGDVSSYTGAMEKRKELQNWITSKGKTIAANDLLKAMANQKAPIDMARVKYSLEHSGAWSPSMWKFFPSFCSRMIQHMLMQAGFCQSQSGVGFPHSWIVSKYISISISINISISISISNKYKYK